MLIGLKGKGIKVFNCLHASPDKIRGFSLVEVLVTTLILSVIFSALIVTLNIGQASFAASNSKIIIQSQVRMAMDWVVKDLHQSISWNVASTISPNNNPTTKHLKFHLWSWNSVTNTWDLSADYIEYNYDDTLNKLTRTFYNDTTKTNMVIEFQNIVEDPFYTTYIGPGDPGNILDVDQLRNNRTLTIVISGEKLVRGTLYMPFALQTEVKIRNG